MFYRVDYVISLILLGFLIGLLCGKRTETRAASGIAIAFYVTIAFLLVLAFLANAVLMLHGPDRVWTLTAGVAGSISNVVYGALFGVAARRQQPRDLLAQPSVLAALRMAAAFTFALAGIGKAFSMSYMTGFFTQSGYSVGFLKFIMLAEVLGGVGLLIPWAFLPSLMGLTIDMFGAVFTHIHNGDSLNDSTGAISMLIRLIAIGLIWALSSAGKSPSSVRRRFVGVCVAVVVSVGIAMSGSIALHHSSQPARGAGESSQR